MGCLLLKRIGSSTCQIHNSHSFPTPFSPPSFHPFLPRSTLPSPPCFSCHLTWFSGFFGMAERILTSHQCSDNLLLSTLQEPTLWPFLSIAASRMHILLLVKPNRIGPLVYRQPFPCSGRGAIPPHPQEWRILTLTSPFPVIRV